MCGKENFHISSQFTRNDEKKGSLKSNQNSQLTNLYRDKDSFNSFMEISSKSLFTFKLK